MWQMRSSAVLAMVCVVLLLASGCALLGSKGPSAVLLTGQALIALKAEFLGAAATYDALYTQKRMTEAQYQKWREFVPGFQKTYDAATRTWLAAAQSQDKSQAEQLQTQVDALRSQVLAFMLGLPLPAPPK